MPRPLKPADAGDEALLEEAEALLRMARRAAALGGAPRLVKRIDAAIASAGGAVRHVKHRRRVTMEAQP